ncbi:hypothetical protein D9758_011811 [Tetrapyrgos nigripes]|uniref:F-box domain-containing protein n=1 Tax=Tetrapyrgos nigripes TaxID=182062 RepID=A0A8H5FP12_9AGAR|nr:hypothetical protein D9758_011811 [Tetrapyrgos nigripes]
MTVPTRVPITSGHSQNINILASLRSNFGTYTANLKDVVQCLREAEKTASLRESQIVSLQNEQQRLFLRISRYKSLLAPIRRLPPELLARIFGFCCKESKANEKMDCPVVRLSQVCAGWRELARTTSSLWTHISVDLSDCEYSIQRVLSMVDTHLSLSKQSPLHISLVLPVTSDDARAVLRAFVPESMRWETVTLDVDRCHLLDTEFTAIKDRLPLLRQLELWPTSTGTFDTESAATVDSFSSAPNLRSLQLGVLDDGGEIYLASTEIRVPWTQLHDLTLWVHRPMAIRERLMSASEARTVTIERCYGPAEDAAEAEPVVHFMRSLTISVDKWDRNLTVFLRLLVLPQLTSLCLSGVEPMYPDTELHLSDIQTFLIRSGCNLTSLSLVSLSNTDHIILQLLECIPSLVDLTIHERPIKGTTKNTILTPHFIEQLSFIHDRNSSRCLLPYLQHLFFQAHHSFAVVLFIGMVRSRWIPNSEHTLEMGVNCLKNVKLRLFGLMTQSERMNKVDMHVGALRILRDAGLHFEVSERDYAVQSSD